MSLSGLLRTQFLQCANNTPLRRKMPKVSFKTLRKRKEKKRLSYINIYSSDYTGEAPLHGWMDPKRVKALFTAYQDSRNTHRFNRIVDPKDKKVIEENAKQYGDFYYHKWRAELIRENQLLAKAREALEEIENLPYYLRDEMNVNRGPKLDISVPENHHFINMYNEQILRTHPEEFAIRMQIGERLEKIVNDELEQGE